MKKAVFPVMLCLLLSISSVSRAQFLMDMIDTSTDVGKGMFSMYKNFNSLRLGGYMQPQFQIAQRQGAKGYAGGDFAQHVNNRFMLRRGRIRVDYERSNKDSMPVVQFAFQFDGTERGVNIRDFWGRFFENKYDMFSLTAGVFPRPFGYEINLSSSDRETPERGRMSQILMRTERDLGAMISWEPRRRKDFWRKLKVDAGFFNGQGLSGTADYDSHKDFIARAYFRQLKVSPKMRLSVGASVLQGGMQQFTPYINKIQGKAFVIDSTGNIDKVAPRHYYGADAQLRVANRVGWTEFRAEYIRGKQTATAATTETPGSIPMAGGVPAPLYIRPFDGAYFYYVQHLHSLKHQLIVKYDWYDPNTEVKGKDIGDNVDDRFTAADIKYNTLGICYLYHFSPQLKMFFNYDMVDNEGTSLEGYTDDLKDNVFTCRLQFRF
ncbi:porin [Chitinophaga horti]|uniref:Porin n=1 Tax=Chitinophaga horti TaxID=2920382 RepID=A0ABY6J0U6_9BACT|nr:porin [Chitinophaga horti]UYQ93255.1 porin [Chitinophaga horti]